MSGYRDDRRQHNRNSGRSGRDDRERSPRREARPNDQVRESRYEAGPSRPTHDRHNLGAQRDSPNTYAERSRLPTEVPVPVAGRKLGFASPAMLGRAGRPVRLDVNFFELQSLPIQKTYCYDVSTAY